MDEEELADAHKQSLGTHAPYDTFGREAAQNAKAAAQEAAAAAVPGLALAGWVEPVPDSIGTSRITSSGMDSGDMAACVCLLITNTSVSKRPWALGDGLARDNPGSGRSSSATGVHIPSPRL